MKILLKIAPLLVSIGFIILLGSLAAGMYNLFGIIGALAIIGIVFVVVGLIVLDLNGRL